MKLEATEPELKAFIDAITPPPVSIPMRPTTTEEQKLQLDVARKDADYWALVAAECASITCFRDLEQLNHYVKHLSSAVNDNDSFKQSLANTREFLTKPEDSKPGTRPVWKLTWTHSMPPEFDDKDCCVWFIHEIDAVRAERERTGNYRSKNIQLTKSNVNDPEYIKWRKDNGS